MHYIPVTYLFYSWKFVPICILEVNLAKEWCIVQDSHNKDPKHNLYLLTGLFLSTLIIVLSEIQSCPQEHIEGIFPKP